MVMCSHFLTFVILCGSVAFVAAGNRNSDNDGAMARSTPVFGFNGATDAMSSGRSLHYYITLSKCTLPPGILTQDFIEPFGGRVEYFRINNNVGTVSAHFSDIRMAKNSTGSWVRVSHFVVINGNDSAIVRTTVFSPDYVFLTSDYLHFCTITTATQTGAIDFYEGSPLGPVTSFTDLVHTLKIGGGIHFDAMMNICPAIPPTRQSLSTLGARIAEFEFLVSPVDEMIRATLQTTIDYSSIHQAFLLHVHTMEIHSNHTVFLTRILARAPGFVPVETETYRCEMETGAPGGAVQFYQYM